MYRDDYPAAAMRQLRLRDDVIPMAGGFYIAEYCSDIAGCFEDGKHLMLWHNEHDLYQKVKYYINNPDNSLAIALAGKPHAESHHTWANGFPTLFEILYIKPSH